MAAESSGAKPEGGTASRWKPWLRLGAAAAVLLLLSQAFWLWQTWPVRELLEPPPATARPAGTR